MSGIHTNLTSLLTRVAQGLRIESHNHGTHQIQFDAGEYPDQSLTLAGVVQRCPKVVRAVMLAIATPVHAPKYHVEAMLTELQSIVPHLRRNMHSTTLSAPTRPSIRQPFLQSSSQSQTRTQLSSSCKMVLATKTPSVRYIPIAPSSQAWSGLAQLRRRLA